MAVHRYDVGTLDKPQPTPQGGLRAPAYLTRTGIFEYAAADGKPVREWRPAEEVFHADSLATLPAAPLTSGHPPGFVSPDNFATYSVGHVGDEVRQDGERVAASIIIQGRKAIAAVERGVREVSCGYACKLDETPGMTPDGKPYDRVQREIRYNHVALVPVGRAGRDVRLRLDAAGEQIDPVTVGDDERNDAMTTYEQVDGVKYEVGTDPHVDACKRRDAAEVARNTEAAELKAAKDKAEARADAAEAKLKDAEKRADEATDMKRLDAMVMKRLALVTQSRKVLGDAFKLDGLSEREIHAAAIAKVAPDVKLEGRSDDYVAAMFDAFCGEAASKRADRAGNGAIRAAAQAATDRADAESPHETARKARQKMIDDNLNAWKQASGKGA